jgi:hypothetical protein
LCKLEKHQKTTARSSGYFIPPFILYISPAEHGLILEPEAVEMDAVPDDTDMLVIKTGFCHLREKDIYLENNPGFAPGMAIFLHKRFPHLRVVWIRFRYHLLPIERQGMKRIRHFLIIPTPFFCLRTWTYPQLIIA